MFRSTGETFPKEGPDGSLDPARREELCSVSISKMKEYLKKHNGWIWDHLEERWKEVGDKGEIKGCRPGQVLLLHPENGGYSPILGWTGDSWQKRRFGRGNLCKRQMQSKDDQSMNGDPQSRIGNWITLKDHIDHVCSEVRIYPNALTFLKITKTHSRMQPLARRWEGAPRLPEHAPGGQIR